MVRHFVRGDTFPIKEQLKALGCRWDGQERAWYTDDDAVYAQAQALLQPAPLLNSPAPADLGTADPVALAAKFGRTAVSGANVESSSVYGLGKGDDGDPNGTLHLVRRKKGEPCVRVLQVARTRRQYFSRDMLDDFDLFGAESGGSYQWDGVEVEPTAEESAHDAAEAEKAAQAKREHEAAVVAAQAEQAARLAAWDAVKVGLVECSAPPVGTVEPTGEKLLLSAKGDASARQVRLADGSLGWEWSSHSYDDDRSCWYLPAAAARAACLAWAAKVGVTVVAAREWLEKYSGCVGADCYRAVAEASESEQAALLEAAAAKKKADLQKIRDQEHRSIRIGVEGRVADLPGKPELVEVRFDEAAFEEYCLALEDRRARNTYDHPTLTGVVVMLRKPVASVPAKGKGRKKAHAAPTLPVELRIHNFCTAAVITAE